MLRLPNVVKVNADQCEFGRTTEVKGQKKLPRKPTAFATNNLCIAKELNRRCAGGHEHFSPMEGRAAKADSYPPELCRTVCRGLREQLSFDKTGLCSFFNLATIELETAIQRIGAPQRWIDQQHEHSENEHLNYDMNVLPIQCKKQGRLRWGAFGG